MSRKMRCAWILLILAPFLVGAKPDPDYPLSEGRIVTRVLAYVGKRYFDERRINPSRMFEKALERIEGEIPEVLADCGTSIGSFDTASDEPRFCSITVGDAKRRFFYPTETVDSLIVSLKEILHFLEMHVGPTIEKKKIEFAAAEGLLGTLDPHTNFLIPEVYKEFKVGTQGEFGGLGIVIGNREGKLTVISPLEDTPAWKAGIKAGDTILQIDEESTVNVDLTEAVSLLRGPVGTRLRLKIERKGRSLVLTLKRAVIHIEAVQSATLTTKKGKQVAYIKVKSFQANTVSDFQKEFAKFSKLPGLAGWIVDLRNNPGGLLEQSVDLADLFLKQGVIVSTIGAKRQSVEKPKVAKDDGVETSLPVIVLINEGSASASEIVAGALQSLNRALVVGQTSFGKGSVQTIYELPFDGALKITIAQYLAAGKQSIQNLGVVPDIALHPVVIDRDGVDLIENKRRSEEDLEKRLESLHGLPTQNVPSGGLRPGDLRPADMGSADMRPGEMSSDEPLGSRFSLAHLAKKPKEEEEYQAKLKVEDDFTVELVTQMLDHVTHSDRRQMLQEAKGILDEVKRQEEGRISQSLKELGIEWGLQKWSGTSQAQLTFQILEKGKPVAAAVAGEKVGLKIIVKNVGSGPFSQLVGLTQSKVSLFQDLEFPLGSIAPGGQASWEVSVNVPPGALSEEIAMTLEFREGNQSAPSPIEVVVPIRGREDFELSYQYELQTQSGNPLRQVAGASDLSMQVRFTNHGPGTLLKPLVTLKNLGTEGLFIEKGRVSLDPLPQRGEKQVELKFRLAGTLAEQSPQLELAILDAETQMGLRQKIHWDPRNLAFSPPTAIRHRPPKIHLAQKFLKVGKTPFILKGVIEDDVRIRDFYIFVGDKKVFYSSNAQGEKKMPFEAELPLEAGSNLITVAARDNDDLESKSHFVVHLEAQSQHAGSLRSPNIQ